MIPLFFAYFKAIKRNNQAKLNNMQDSFQALIFNASKLYKRAQYKECIEYINTHLQALGEDRLALGKAYCIQAQAYYRLERYDEAIIAALHALENNPNDEEAYYWLGNIYHDIGFYKMSEDAYKKAIALSPDKEHYYLNLAAVYKMQNKKNEAIKLYQKIIELNPQNTKAYRNMSACFKYDSLYHEHHAKILDLLITPSLSEEEKMECYFVLGKIHHDCNDFQKAFIYMQAANALRAQMAPFDVVRFSKKIDSIMHYFKNAQNNLLLSEAKGENLIFIIGLPRAGKSLIEQILVETKEAVGLGEIGVFDKLLKKSEKIIDKKLAAKEEIDLIDKEMTDFITHEYLAEVKRRAFGDNQFIIDTTPTNYQHIGLIAKIFPDAKFICCHRHPLDHILQIYFKYFAEGNGFSYDLIKLTYFYVDYHRLMNFWKKNIVMQMLEINYEELIRRPREQIQRVCKFVELPTPRAEPKLYYREIGLWKYYDSYLGLVKRILKKSGFKFEF